MAGTTAGGRKAADKNIQRDPDFYKRIGTKGGKLGKTGGFASNKVGADGLTGRERAMKVGSKGGQISRRKPKTEEHKRRIGDAIREAWKRRTKNV